MAKWNLFSSNFYSQHSLTSLLEINNPAHFIIKVIAHVVCLNDNDEMKDYILSKMHVIKHACKFKFNKGE
jgi:hypothetical protein